MRIETRILNKALIAAGRLVDKRSSIPTLRCIRLDAGRRSLRLTVTDLEVWREQSIAGEYDPQDAEWSALVEFSTLKKSMPKPKRAPYVRLEPGADAGFLHLNGEGYTEGDRRSSAILPTEPLDTWPTKPELDDEEPVVFDGEEWRELVAQVLPAVSTEESRFQLSGARLELNGGARAIATDGHRLHLAECPLVVEAPAPGLDDDEAPLVPYGLLKVAQMDSFGKRSGRGSKASTPTVHLAKSHHHLTLSTSAGVRYTSRLLEGTFPAYSRVMELEPPECRIRASAGSWRAAIDAFKGAKLEVCRVELDDEAGSVRLVAKDTDGLELAADVAGASLWGGLREPKHGLNGRPANAFGVNPRYIRDVFASADDDAGIELRLVDCDTQIRVTRDDRPRFDSVVMGIRL